jgi:hypothetical protein
MSGPAPEALADRAHGPEAVGVTVLHHAERDVHHGGHHAPRDERDCTSYIKSPFLSCLAPEAEGAG